MYVSINKQLVHFQYCLGVPSRICQVKGLQRLFCLFEFLRRQHNTEANWGSSSSQPDHSTPTGRTQSLFVAMIQVGRSGVPVPELARDCSAPRNTQTFPEAFHAAYTECVPRLFPGRKAAGAQFWPFTPFRGGDKNEWSYEPTPPTHLNGEDRNKLTNYINNERTNQPTQWSSVLLQKLTVPQLVEKLPEFYATRRFITALTKARRLSLSTVRSIQSIPPHPTP
jgi:hypothetical protein